MEIHGGFLGFVREIRGFLTGFKSRQDEISGNKVQVIPVICEYCSCYVLIWCAPGERPASPGTGWSNAGVGVGGAWAGPFDRLRARDIKGGAQRPVPAPPFPLNLYRPEPVEGPRQTNRNPSRTIRRRGRKVGWMISKPRPRGHEHVDIRGSNPTT